MDVAASLASLYETQNVFEAMATILAMTAYLFPLHYDIPNGDCFDYIVIGAGSAGSIIATRLSEDPHVRVLLVEAGGDPPFESDVPGYARYLKKTPVDWNYTSIWDSVPQEFHINQVTDVTRGKMLGGSSSINLMFYVRGSPIDFNSWAEITKDESWNFNNVQHYFKKGEDLREETILNSPTGIYHGTKGYVGITMLKFNETQKYLDAFAEIGEKTVLDVSGWNTVGYTQPLVIIADGARQSTARSYLRPNKNRPNLLVAKHTMVIQILFDKNKNAIGVIALKQNGERVMIRARREVIVSAGAINSPQLLMLSGIGPKKHLKDMGINLIADLPVGEYLQDHSPAILLYCSDETPSDKPKNPYEFPSPSILGYAALNKSQTYPDYQALILLLDAPGLLSTCSFSHTFKPDICQKFYNEAKGRQCLFSEIIPLRPKSRGRILLRSSNPMDHPEIFLGQYADKRDLDDTASYLQDYDRVSQSTFFKKVNAKLVVPPQCEGLKRYSWELYKCHAQTMVTTIFHYSCTCAMGSVVDSRLRVYGVNRLRVADGSVMPAVTSGNTNAPIMMIGEKAADIIKQDNAAKY